MPKSPPTHRPAYALSRDQVRKQSNREYNRTKRTGQAFYDSNAWRRLRASYARRHPLCVACCDVGRATAVDVVDHIIPIKDGGSLLCESNLQSLCNMHHNQKSATERGRAGQKSTD